MTDLIKVIEKDYKKKYDVKKIYKNSKRWLGYLSKRTSEFHKINRIDWDAGELRLNKAIMGWAKEYRPDLVKKKR